MKDFTHAHPSTVFNPSRRHRSSDSRRSPFRRRASNDTVVLEDRLRLHALGEIRGRELQGVHAFHGIPFAEPPVGPLRFMPPKPPKPWSEPRDAINFGPPAMQEKDPKKEDSEDCLYLNVYKPTAPGPHPVLVWIHGGGFVGGASSGFDGPSFARDGVVTVTIAYRLGVFGFCDVQPLLGDAYAGSANNAMRDIIMALQWVQQNIAAFGGDPKRVTVGGQSAGAKMTGLLMGIPSAQPLFSQMISESGGADRIWAATRAAEVATMLGQKFAGKDHRPASDLLTATPQDLIAAQAILVRSFPAGKSLRCELDPTLIPRSALQAIREGSARGKRLLVGSNRDETASFQGPDPKHDPGAPDVGNMPLDQFTATAEKYAAVYPDMSVAMRRIRSLSAEEYWVPSVRVADAVVTGGGEAFMYRFDYSGEGMTAGLVPHSHELQFVWGHGGKSAESKTLATSVHTAWVAFIKGQPPAGSGLPDWTPYSVAKRSTMILNATSTVEDQPNAKELALWDGMMME